MLKYLRVQLSDEGLVCEVISSEDTCNFSDLLLLSEFSLRFLSRHWNLDSPLDFLTFLNIVFPPGSNFTVDPKLDLEDTINDLARYLCNDQIAMKDFVQEVLDWNAFRSFCERRTADALQILLNVLSDSASCLRIIDPTLTVTNSPNLELLDNKEEEIEQLQKKWNNELVCSESNILVRNSKLESMVETLASASGSLERPKTPSPGNEPTDATFPENDKRNLTRADTPIPTRPRKTPQGILKQYQSQSAPDDILDQQQRGLSKQVQWISGTIFHDKKTSNRFSRKSLQLSYSSFISYPKFFKKVLKRKSPIAISADADEFKSRYRSQNLIYERDFDTNIKSRHSPLSAPSADSDSEDVWEDDEVEWETLPAPSLTSQSHRRKATLRQAAQDVLNIRKAHQERTRGRSEPPFSIARHMFIPSPQFSHAPRLRDRQITDLEVIEEVDEELEEEEEDSMPIQYSSDAVVEIVDKLAAMSTENTIPLASGRRRRQSSTDETVQTTPELEAQQSFLIQEQPFGSQGSGPPSGETLSPSLTAGITVMKNEVLPHLHMDASVDSSQDIIYTNLPYVLPKRSSSLVSKSAMSSEEIQSLKDDVQAALNAPLTHGWKHKFGRLPGISGLQRSVSDGGITTKVSRTKSLRRTEEFAQQSGGAGLENSVKMERENSLKQSWSFRRISEIFDKRGVGEHKPIGYVLSSEEDNDYRDGGTSSKELRRQENMFGESITAFID